ncbi:MAG TPA: SRPBCC domain-containing protein [Caulobacter sp.]|nr:SRPBCC domain-containing protein [Caulobacter sp.]
MKRMIIAAAAAALLAGGALAAEPSWRDYPGVENTSFVEADGRRALQLSVVVPAAADEVWAAFTTEAGWKAWASPTAYVDFRVGGSLETSYSAGAAKGDPNNIVNRIEAYVPGRMLAIRNVQAPKGFPAAEAFGQTVTVLEFTPVGDKATRVTLTNLGYGQGPDFDTAYRHFEWGNAYSLDGLRRRFADGPVDWEKRAEQRKAAEDSAKKKGD